MSTLPPDLPKYPQAVPVRTKTPRWVFVLGGFGCATALGLSLCGGLLFVWIHVWMNPARLYTEEELSNKVVGLNTKQLRSKLGSPSRMLPKIQSRVVRNPENLLDRADDDIDPNNAYWIYDNLHFVKNGQESKSAAAVQVANGVVIGIAEESQVNILVVIPPPDNRGGLPNFNDHSK